MFTPRIEQAIYSKAYLQVQICATCLSAVSWTLDGIDFPIVFLDEASMATEPLSLVPLMKGVSVVLRDPGHQVMPH